MYGRTHGRTGNSDSTRGLPNVLKHLIYMFLRKHMRLNLVTTNGLINKDRQHGQATRVEEPLDV